MLLKLILFASMTLLVSADSQFGISSAFLHIATPPSQSAFLDLGEYSGQTASGVGYKKNYYFSKYFKAVWVNAKAICKSFDLELATFETSDEAQQFLNKIAASYYFRDNDHVYALVDGFTPTPKSTTDWYWTNSGLKIPYNLQWAAGEPNNHAEDNENCLSIGRTTRTQTLGFNDITCFYKSANFVCQKTVMT